MPAQPSGIPAGAFEGLLETLAPFLVRPVIGVAEERKMRETAGEKMFGDKLGGMRVILQYAREF